MKKLFYALLVFAFFYACTTSKKSNIDLLTIQSKIFNNQRNLRIYLPAEYDGKKAFKVLYLNDGQNAFGEQGIKQKDDWRVDEIIDSLVNRKEIEPLIVVGIDNIGMTTRGNEYLPWEDIYLNPRIPNPEGQKYPDFLIKEVMPIIKSNYRIKEGKENTGIGGFSYGGLISVYTAMVSPEYFGFLLAETPSLYVNDKRLLLEAKKSTKGWPRRIYMGVGTNELALENCQEDNEDNKMAVNDIKQIVSIIQSQSPSKTEINIVKCATHSFEEASKRLPKALKFVLK